MTTEEKARAYDEALGRARKQRNDYQKELNKANNKPQLAGLLKAGITAIELALPELADSEDERIRKYLIEELKALKSVGELKFSIPAPTKEECIVYLEKQKVTAAIPDELVECYKNLCERGNRGVASLINAINGVNEQKEQKPLKVGKNAYFDPNTDMWFIKKEQKPVDVEYIGGIREELLGIEDNAKNIDGLTESQWVAIRAAHRLLGEYLEQEQKPVDRFEEAREKYQVEWGEEDNIGWDEAFACVTRAEKAAKNEEELQNAVTAEKWLKEIKFKYYVHPVKQEWSEEDEDILNCCISSIEEAKENRYAYKETDGDTSYDREIAWLKSLRPQPIQLKEAYKDGFQTARHATALTFMNYLDENRPEGKMGLSNAECEDIDKAFKENDWKKIMRYANKYSWKPSEEQMEALESAIDACESEWAYQDDELRSLFTDLEKLCNQ